MKSPLMVLMIRAGHLDASRAHAKAIREAFDSVSLEDGADDKRELLQPGEIREFHLADGELRSNLVFLGSASRLLVVILDARSDGFEELEKAVRDELDRWRVENDQGQRVLAIRLNVAESVKEPHSEDERIERFGLADLDERDLRLPFLALQCLHAALWLFSTGNPKSGPRLFFSHAKRDGVPLTTAVLDWTKRLRGIDTFYDTKDLDVEGDIDQQLESAVESAVIIVFRSEVFDQRYWCQKEVLWAEQHGRPVVTVDARWNVEHRASVISFDATPVVRIPDGSLVRILMAALTEALRVSLFEARVELHRVSIASAPDVRTIARTPSLVSLEAAVRKLAASGKAGFVVYPNPALPTALEKAVTGLAQGLMPGCEVRSLDEFRLVR